MSFRLSVISTSVANSVLVRLIFIINTLAGFCSLFFSGIDPKQILQLSMQNFFGGKHR